ncbi:MAG: alpha-L-fucosidase [Candidatus Marinimicrobia bacterium]|nr:alpha-L-fucosidase [Candidatus Neomarinimicrobiota bacterium]
MSKKYINFISILVIIFTLLIGNLPAKDYLNEPEKRTDLRMEWWRNARFGMFIHWGLYSIPAGEWKGETNHAEWIRTTAQIPLETYEKFLDDFNPINYDPERWVSLAKKAGMKYIVITTKHHDGFCLFDSKYTEFDVMSTPYDKDLLKPLAEECQAQGIKIGWYHSIMDWHHPDYLPRRGWEKKRSTKNADFGKYVRYMKNQLRELLSGYGDIGVLWFDGEWEKTWNDKLGRDLYNYVRSLQNSIIINNRVGASRSGMAGFSDSKISAGDFGTPEQEIPATGKPGVDWETCMTMNNHWGYNKYDDNWKSTEDLIHKLIDIASKGGNFLLNVGPQADGTFPEESVTRLEEIGQWMDKYGAAIYGTKASPFKNLEWGRCTQKQLEDGSTNLYFHIFDWPANNKLIIPGLVNKVNKAFHPDGMRKQSISFRKKLDEVIIDLNPNKQDKYASVIVLNIEGKPEIAYAPEIIAFNKMFVDSVRIKINSSVQEKRIYYTVDGTDPGQNSNLYQAPIVLYNNAQLKARLFIDYKAVSPVSSKKFYKVKPLPAENISKISLKNGILCEEYKGDWNRLPDFKKLKPIKVSYAKNISLNNSQQKEYFGLRYTGFLKIEQDAVYKFNTVSDDGSKLYIDNKLVVDNDGLHSMNLAEGSIPLAKGFHKIEVQYFDKTGGNYLKIYCQTAGDGKNELPSENLYINQLDKK